MKKIFKDINKYKLIFILIIILNVAIQALVHIYILLSNGKITTSPDARLYLEIAYSIRHFESQILGAYYSYLSNRDIGAIIMPGYPLMISPFSENLHLISLFQVLLLCLGLYCLYRVLYNKYLIFFTFVTAVWIIVSTSWTYHNQALIESPTISFLMFSIYFLDKYFKDYKLKDFAWFSVIFGVLIALNNRYIFHYCGFLPFLLVLSYFERRIKFRHLVFSFLIVSAIMAPWHIRQYFHYGEFVLFSPKRSQTYENATEKRERLAKHNKINKFKAYLLDSLNSPLRNDTVALEEARQLYIERQDKYRKKQLVMNETGILTTTNPKPQVIVFEPAKKTISPLDDKNIAKNKTDNKGLVAKREEMLGFTPINRKGAKPKVNNENDIKIVKYGGKTKSTSKPLLASNKSRNKINDDIVYLNQPPKSEGTLSSENRNTRNILRNQELSTSKTQNINSIAREYRSTKPLNIENSRKIRDFASKNTTNKKQELEKLPIDSVEKIILASTPNVKLKYYDLLSEIKENQVKVSIQNERKDVSSLQSKTAIMSLATDLESNTISTEINPKVSDKIISKSDLSSNKNNNLIDKEGVLLEKISSLSKPRLAKANTNSDLSKLRQSSQLQDKPLASSLQKSKNDITKSVTNRGSDELKTNLTTRKLEESQQLASIDLQSKLKDEQGKEKISQEKKNVSIPSAKTEQSSLSTTSRGVEKLREKELALLESKKIAKESEVKNTSELDNKKNDISSSGISKSQSNQVEISKPRLAKANTNSDLSKLRKSSQLQDKSLASSLQKSQNDITKSVTNRGSDELKTNLTSRKLEESQQLTSIDLQSKLKDEQSKEKISQEKKNVSVPSIKTEQSSLTTTSRRVEKLREKELALLESKKIAQESEVRSTSELDKERNGVSSIGISKSQSNQVEISKPRLAKANTNNDLSKLRQSSQLQDKSLASSLQKSKNTISQVGANRGSDELKTNITTRKLEESQQLASSDLQSKLKDEQGKEKISQEKKNVSIPSTKIEQSSLSTTSRGVQKLRESELALLESEKIAKESEVRSTSELDKKKNDVSSSGISKSQSNQVEISKPRLAKANTNSDLLKLRQSNQLQDKSLASSLQKSKNNISQVGTNRGSDELKTNITNRKLEENQQLASGDLQSKLKDEQGKEKISQEKKNVSIPSTKTELSSLSTTSRGVEKLREKELALLEVKKSQSDDSKNNRLYNSKQSGPKLADTKSNVRLEDTRKARTENEVLAYNVPINKNKDLMVTESKKLLEERPKYKSREIKKETVTKEKSKSKDKDLKDKDNQKIKSSKNVDIVEQKIELPKVKIDTQLVISRKVVKEPIVLASIKEKTDFRQKVVVDTLVVIKRVETPAPVKGKSQKAKVILDTATPVVRNLIVKSEPKRLSSPVINYQTDGISISVQDFKVQQIRLSDFDDVLEYRKFENLRVRKMVPTYDAIINALLKSHPKFGDTPEKLQQFLTDFSYEKYKQLVYDKFEPSNKWELYWNSFVSQLTFYRTDFQLTAQWDPRIYWPSHYNHPVEVILDGIMVPLLIINMIPLFIALYRKDWFIVSLFVLVLLHLLLHTVVAAVLPRYRLTIYPVWITFAVYGYDQITRFLIKIYKNRRELWYKLEGKLNRKELSA